MSAARERRFGALLLCCLLASGAALLLSCGGSPPAPSPALRSPLPTRAATATPLPVSVLLDGMGPALLSAHPEAALPIWEEVRARAPQSPLVMREGARLALALGDLKTAEQRAWEAVIAAPRDPTAWALLGAIQQQKGDHTLAEQAFSHAEALSPTLGADIFADRWLAAREVGDGERLTALAQIHLARHPEDPLATYYRAEALLASGHRHAALELLLLSVEPEAPAVLWYTLGRAYLQVGAEEEAAITLETALRAHSRGDRTLLLAARDPLHALYRALGAAYVGSGQCEKAVQLLQLPATPYPDLRPLLESAQTCPTPTPTVTPWLPEGWQDSP
ncbi:MAG: tetratricopeptide repeat protein [Anaerolineae bacterium]